MAEEKKESPLEMQLQETDKSIAELQGKREEIGARVRKEKEQEEERDRKLTQKLIAYLQTQGCHIDNKRLSLSIGEMSQAFTTITINARNDKYGAKKAVEIIEKILGEDAIRKHEHDSDSWREQAGIDRAWDPNATSITDGRGDYVETPFYSKVESDKHTLKVDTQALKKAFGMENPEEKLSRAV